MQTYSSAELFQTRDTLVPISTPATGNVRIVLENDTNVITSLGNRDLEMTRGDEIRGHKKFGPRLGLWLGHR